MSDFPDWGGGGGGGGGYLSLTGDGQTQTPGALTQAGEFTVTAIDATLDVGSGTPLNGSINLSSTTGEVTVDALGFIVNTDGIELDSGTGLVQVDTTQALVVNTGGLITKEGTNLGNNVGIVTPGSQPIFIMDELGAGIFVQMWMFNGNPNGHINPGGGHNGDLCVDTGTPNLWQWHTGTSTWVAL